MSNPLQQTTNVDVDAVPETTIAESQAPTGAANPALPAVGTNKVNQWATWDPNQWWTDWTLPPDPRPSWEQWFDWVNQLRALVPALGEAGRDWQVMIGQFDNSLQTVRGMRTELAEWTGPSAQTMSESLDRMENSITTRAAAISENPARLQQLAQTINDAVAPMAALDAEYQQVLADLAACRQVAERGKPIMLNLATELLRAGTDLENSVQTENLAPQPVPPQQLLLTNGPQGPGQQLAQVAGSANLTDPGTVITPAQVPVAGQPATAAASNLTDPGQVQTAQQAAVAHVPGVTVGAGDPLAATPAMPAQPAAPALSPTLAGVSSGSAAPTLAAAQFTAAPSLVAPGPAMSAMPVMPAMPATQFAAAPLPVHGGPLTPAPAPTVAPAKPKEERTDAVAVIAVPLLATSLPSAASGSVAVPAGLQGRTAGQRPATPVITGVARRGRVTPQPQDGAGPLDSEVFEAEDAGTGVVTGRPRQA